MNVKKKRCLVLSYGPVPTPEHTKVEGGGLRCWGLAQGIKANAPEMEITVAYHEGYKQPKFTKRYKGIDIKTWSIDTVEELVQDFDTVLVSYAMGDLSVKVVDNIRTDQQLILDCYAPFYLEVSARGSEDLLTEYNNYHADIGRISRILLRGDLFLCASEAQKRFYKGVLAAVGRINPATYGDEMLVIVPYGIYRDAPKAKAKPVTKLVGQGVKKILWFGGLYPWFDLRNLIQAVELVNKTVPARLVIVGARNPFNVHPDFIRRYDEMVEYINSDPKFKELVKLQDWVRFEDRADWYLDSDAVVVINELGDENDLAWRTRMIDFTWASLPIATNGGDGLSEMLIEQGAALRLTGLEPKALAEDMAALLKDDQALSKVKQNLAKIRPALYWDVITKELTDLIRQHKRARDISQFGVYSIEADQSLSRNQLGRLITRTRKLPVYARKYGLKNTYYAVRTIAVGRLNRGAQKTREPRIIVLSHQFDLSGAPYVLIDFLKELKKNKPPRKIDFYTFNPAHHDNITTLNKLGIKPRILLNRDSMLQFVRGDVLVANTVAYSVLTKESIYKALEDGQLQKFIWYAHEDNPQDWFNPTETRRVKKLLSEKKIVFLIAAQRILDNYQQHFDNTSQIKLQPYKIVTSEKYHKRRQAGDFQTINFMLSGSMGDARKGHLPILYAFIDFYENFFKPNPGKYRDFKLIFVGGIPSELILKQILNHGPKALGKRFKHYSQISKDKLHDLLLQTNITICYSIQESLPLSVFDGMIAGHPIMRNDSSGMVEQLQPGKNGFLLESRDFGQVVETIRKVLDPQQTTNQQLAKMSDESYKIAKAQEGNSYQPMVDEVFGTI